MSFSLYDVSVPVFRQYLVALSAVLAKAEAHCATGAASESDLVNMRLYDDMLPFTFQVQQAIFHSAGAVALMRGQSYPQATGLETLAGSRAAVDAAVAYLDGVKPGDLPTDPEAEVILAFPGRTMKFGAADYLFTFAYGQFFFHVTTAYDILRMKGVNIGKLDFMGAIKMRSMA